MPIEKKTFDCAHCGAVLEEGQEFLLPTINEYLCESCYFIEQDSNEKYKEEPELDNDDLLD